MLTLVRTQSHRNTTLRLIDVRPQAAFSRSLSPSSKMILMWLRDLSSIATGAQICGCAGTLKQANICTYGGIGDIRGGAGNLLA